MVANKLAGILVTSLQPENVNLNMLIVSVAFDVSIPLNKFIGTVSILQKVSNVPINRGILPFITGNIAPKEPSISKSSVGVK